MENDKSYTITLDGDPTLHRFIAKCTGVASLPYSSGKTLLKCAASYNPMAIFIDIHLDESENGLHAIPELRKRWIDTPIFVMTSEPKPDLIGQALALGANDFLRKPFPAAELTGRLYARVAELNVRRKADFLSIEDFTLCFSRGSIEKEGQIAFLPDMELRILTMLIENSGLLVPKAEIKTRIWGRIKIADNTFDKKISAIRRAFENIHSRVLIRTVYGRGVIFETNQKSDIAA